jgi:hypothetical protein
VYWCNSVEDKFILKGYILKQYFFSKSYILFQDYTFQQKQSSLFQVSGDSEYKSKIENKMEFYKFGFQEDPTIPPTDKMEEPSDAAFHRYRRTEISTR